MNTLDTAQLTMVDLFLKHELETPHATFLRQPTGSSWKEYSWSEVWKTASKVVAAMQKAGLKKGDRVAILSQNCAEWIICDLAIMMGGFISVPLYANVNASTMHDILVHSESKLLFVGKLNPIDWDNVRMSVPESVLLVSMNGYDKENLLSWSQFMQADKDATLATPSTNDILTIIYTSGTTGTPKGVIHTHRSIINAIQTAADVVLLNRKGNRFFSYLPLSHAAERGLVEFGAMYCGGTISFVESQDTFVRNIKETLPTHFFGVPRIWEKFQSRILEILPEQKLKILLRLPIISFLVKSKIRKSLGLNKALILLSGAAPISPDLIRWYKRINIYIQEAYGMSENFSVCAINPADDIRVGTVGKIFENQEIKIDPQTNEVIQKCDWLMQGYYKDPKLTEETIQSGYLYTGDVGELSKDGYLKITGRVKDIFKTSKGEYIAPAPIEKQFLAHEEVDQACVMGSTYPLAFIIVVLSPVGKTMNRDAINRLLLDTLNQYNQSCMPYQALQKVIVAKEEWTIENDLFTPTLKMKRSALAKKYEAAMEPIYLAQEKVSWE